MMTPGPARRIVTLLPRNRPTPIAPPMASIVSWRCVSLRRSSSASGRTAGESALVLMDCGGCWRRESEGSPMLRQIEQNVAETVNLIHRVVVDERSTDYAAFQRHAEPLHQARSVHVTITNADSGMGESFGNFGRSDIGKIEAECGHAVVHLAFFR